MKRPMTHQLRIIPLTWSSSVLLQALKVFFFLTFAFVPDNVRVDNKCPPRLMFSFNAVINGSQLKLAMNDVSIKNLKHRGGEDLLLAVL